MGNKLDLTGQRFGRLVAIRETGEKNLHGSYFWFCKCDCGNEVVVSVNPLRNGDSKSCGCLNEENRQKNLRPPTKEEREKGFKKIFVEKTNLPALRREEPVKNNTSGVTGVSFHKAAKKWQSYISFQGERIPLGIFSDKQDAIDARKEAEEKYFKPILEKYGKSVGTK